MLKPKYRRVIRMNTVVTGIPEVGNKLLECAVKFTDTYREYSSAPVAIREAMCMKTQFPAMLRDLTENDCFAGRSPAKRVLYFSPFMFVQLPLGKFLGKQGGYCFDFDAASWNLSTPEEHAQFDSLRQFWQKECSNARCYDSWTDEMQTFVGIVAPETPGSGYQALGGSNGAHVVMDYSKLLALGIPGLCSSIDARRREALKKREDASLFDGMLIALDILEDVCRHYELQARNLAQAADPESAARMKQIASSLSAIRSRPPQTFHEALQLIWIYNVLNADLPEISRFDDILAGYYEHDINAGILTEQAAEAMLLALWKLIRQEGNKVSDRILVGGLGRKNGASADRLARLVLRTIPMHRDVSPQFTLRIHRVQDPELLSLALDAVAEGCVFPLIYNDDALLPGVQKSFGVDSNTAMRYHPFGCGECTIAGVSPSPVDAAVNIVKSLEAAMRRGSDSTGLRIGPDTGDIAGFQTFDDLLLAFEKQLSFALRLAAQCYVDVYDRLAEQCSFLYISMLTDDCVARGRAVFNGGILHRGACVVGQGYTNTADSLYAIRKLVYEEKACTLPELVAAMDTNFTSNPGLLMKIRRLPKFGNDDSGADAMFALVWRTAHELAGKAGTEAGLDFCVLSSVNPGGFDLGHQSGAGADGRLRSEPFAIGTAPANGSDRNGLTALLNSLSKFSPAHGGATSNVKISSEYLRKDRKQFEKMLDVFFERGGQQLSVSSVGIKDLEDALAHPEKYHHLLVRVGGWTSRFVECPRRTQQDIIRRTLH
ncbi:MAG: hypothetical protein C0404_06085 [Verrucomicrobia bacterium]|nr:hypothetical protein [Verrucomicrobiota bacterium]